MTDTFPEHPKTVQLSDGAFRAIITYWCYSHKLRTDGFLPKNVAKMHATPTRIRELVSAGFLTEIDGGYDLHDYLKHQWSAKEIESMSQKKKTAGSQGGSLGMHKRWHVARDRFSDDCQYCQEARTA
ncbi:hypothetical protein NBM05_08335 [Rothia sp. AR01]|uniref:Uncharacterized protein n=1 Tax=Rothia santali TaxID=2949643 RepID=A0A9X2KIA7_9MICC|nr:hypothetical protein [Rothia santali]MCP3426008.1 hypothetical protein [Rothia santali]